MPWHQDSRAGVPCHPGARVPILDGDTRSPWHRTHTKDYACTHFDTFPSGTSLRGWWMSFNIHLKILVWSTLIVRITPIKILFKSLKTISNSGVSGISGWQTLLTHFVNKTLSLITSLTCFPNVSFWTVRVLSSHDFGSRWPSLCTTAFGWVTSWNGTRVVKPLNRDLSLFTKTYLQVSQSTLLRECLEDHSTVHNILRASDAWHPGMGAGLLVIKSEFILINRIYQFVCTINTLERERERERERKRDRERSEINRFKRTIPACRTPGSLCTVLSLCAQCCHCALCAQCCHCGYLDLGRNTQIPPVSWQQD
jgi:hypothetical protein